MPKEKVLDYVAGILWGGGSGGRIYSYEVLGKGKILRPENAMIVTNQRVLFIVVPLPGADQVIAGTNIGMWQWVTQAKEIEKKLKKLLSSKTIPAILKMHEKNYFVNLSDIEKVKLGFITKKLIIKTKDKKRYTYSIRIKEDREKIKKIFKNYF